MTDDVTQAPTTAETAKTSNSSLPLPKYQSHKIVEALKIEHIEGWAGGGARIYPSDTRYSRFTVSAEYVAKHAPRAGGYWVRYADGYESFSPAAAFEEGNTLIQVGDRFIGVEGQLALLKSNWMRQRDFIMEMNNGVAAVAIDIKDEHPEIFNKIKAALDKAWDKDRLPAGTPIAEAKIVEGAHLEPIGDPAPPEGETTVYDPDTHA